MFYFPWKNKTKNMTLPIEIQRYIGEFLMPNAIDVYHHYEVLMWQLELLHENLQLKHRPFTASEFALWRRITNANKRCRIRGNNPVFICEY
jgi:hypothetical protein